MNQRLELNDESAKLVIPAAFDGQKQIMLNIWLALWSVCGLLIAAQFFLPGNENMTTYLIIWMGFWIYFEYKVIYAFRWRKWGKEVIEFSEGNLSVTTEIAGRGLPKMYDVEYTKNFRKVEDQGGAFLRIMNQSYWNPGAEKIAFDYKGKEIRMGRELDEQNIKRVLKWLQNQVKQRQS